MTKISSCKLPPKRSPTLFAQAVLKQEYGRFARVILTNYTKTAYTLDLN